ncbi:MAG: 7TM diverse intracellular signaling domain-containing protein, partial [Bdellovibrionota bacterium]
ATGIELSYYEDKSTTLTAQDVVSRASTLPWTAVAGPKARFGYSTSRFWIRLRLPPASELPASDSLILEIPFAYNTQVNFITARNGKIERQSIAGMAVPVRERDNYSLRTGMPTFRLPAPHAADLEYFASVEGNFPISFPVKLMAAQEFVFHTMGQELFLGMFFGAMLLALLSNGVLALSLRSRLYGYYSLFVAFVAMLYMGHHGLTIQLLWGNSPWWAVREMDFYGGAALLFYGLFVREFLVTRRNTPILDKVLLFLLAVSSARSIWILIHPYQVAQMIGQIAVVFTNILVLVIAIKASTMKLRAAWYFLLSSFVFNVGFVLYVLQEANLIWLGHFIEFAPHAGSLAEVTLLSFALADRIRQTNLELVQQRTAMVQAEKLGALGRMAGEIAHEINNPLAIIHGNAALLLKLEGSPQVKEFAGTIEATALRISNIVKGMRALARDSRQDPFQPTPLSSILQDAMIFCSDKSRMRGVNLQVVRPEMDLTLRCRSSEISQVLVNLLNNSFDAVEGMNEPWVKVEAVKRSGLVELAVTDSGRGVPRELRPRIQEPFFTTKEAGKGLGLGLSISRTIVESHGGSLWLDEKSEHTRFAFTVPVSN